MQMVQTYTSYDVVSEPEAHGLSLSQQMPIQKMSMSFSSIQYYDYHKGIYEYLYLLEGSQISDVQCFYRGD